MVREGIGSIFKRKDGKFFVYLPQGIAEDTAFPFDPHSSMKTTVRSTDDWKLVIEHMSK